MKKNLMLVLLALALLIPGPTQAAVEAGAGNITLLAHIDFVGRYSEEDMESDEAWQGYETYNLEFAVLGLAGTVGDNVSWVVTQAFTFIPNGSLYSEAAAEGLEDNNAVGSGLLDARINVHLGENLMISAGRFLPPTSMTWAPHQMKNLHTINYPLINGSGLQGWQTTAAMNVLMPLPTYQAGVMLTGMMGPVTIQVGSFNGSGIYAGSDVGGIDIWGPNNMIDVDKTKGMAYKLSLDMESLHVGGWYYGETAAVTYPNGSADGVDTWDGKIDQWGAEVAYTTEMFLVQGQYLSSTLDAMDSAVDDDLVQTGWYALAGVNLGPAQLVYRYDVINYDEENLFDDDPIAPTMTEDNNEESAQTIGLNFTVNENTTAGLNYTIRDVEDWDAETDEWAFILEVDLF